MKRIFSARQRIAATPLDGALIHRIARRILPRRNDYMADPALFDALLPELQQLGITTRGRLERLLTRHRRALLTDDRSRLAPHEIRIYIEMYGDLDVRDALRRQYWFAYPALIRNALEREFGENAVPVLEPGRAIPA